MTVKIMTSPSLWMESGAARQLAFIDTYPGVSEVVGLPDLHGGRSPVGLAVISRDFIYPYILGNDVGCGMALFETDIPCRRFKLDRAEKALSAAFATSDADSAEQFRKGSTSADKGRFKRRRLSLETTEEPVEPLAETSALPEEETPLGLKNSRDLGTIGGGNHFAEFQKIERIVDAKAAESLGLDGDKIFLLIHSGSRSLGQAVLSAFASETGYGLADPKAMEYLAAHDEAMAWAVLNRRLIAQRVLDAIGVKSGLRLAADLPHNFLESFEGSFIHRKGAVSADVPFVVLPGSRGTMTYLLKPKEAAKDWGRSLSHGAGRKWPRSLCRERLSKKKDKFSLTRTELGGRVVCRDAENLFQEAPEAYKDVRQVVDCLTSREAAEVSAIFRPLLTFKG
ncbi:MAG: RtcB family protein [Deltaproteobacteria bacterium]|nr:RtcB family protein [Deltaproteobacteria bacterium]